MRSPIVKRCALEVYGGVECPPQVGDCVEDGCPWLRAYVPPRVAEPARPVQDEQHPVGGQ